MTAIADTAAPRLTARAALLDGVRLLRVHRRSVLWVGAAATLLIVAVFGLMVAGTRLTLGHDPFNADAPRSGAAEALSGWSIVAVLLAWSYIGSVAYGAFALIAAQNQADARGAVSASVRRLWRDVWWAPLAFLAAAVAVALIVPAVVVVAPLAAIAAARVSGLEMRARQLGHLLGRMCVVALIPTALSGSCWGLAAVAAQFESPPPWGSALILTAGAGASVAVMALTAAASVPLVDESAQWAALQAALAAPPAPTGEQPPAGWYRTEGWTLQWWDGVRWTEHRVVPLPVSAPPARGPLGWLGLVFALSPLVTLTIAGFLVMGDPYLSSRAGVASSGGEVHVVNAVCPGERLTEVRLTRLTSNGAPAEVLWSATGSVPLPAQFLLGDAPAGMVTTKSLVRTLRPADELSLTVRTDQLEHPEPLEFSLRQLPGAGVLGLDGTVRSVDQFRRTVLADMPCDDPYGEAHRRTVLNWALVGAATPVACGVVLLLVDRRRRRKRSSGAEVA